MNFNYFSFVSKRSLLSASSWFVAHCILLLIFLPRLSGASPGLDASWSYGISYASTQKLVYGKDIIFTYGPFGYLINGAVLNDIFYPIFLFRLFVHTLFISLLYLNIFYTKSLIQKLLVFGTAIFFYTLGGWVEYEIVLSTLLIVKNSSIISQKHFRKLSLLLGVVTGLMLLTKFTVGVSVCSIFLCSIVSDLYQGNRKNSNSKKILFSVLDFLFSITVTIAFFVSSDKVRILICFFTYLPLSFLLKNLIRKGNLLNRQSRLGYVLLLDKTEPENILSNNILLQNLQQVLYLIIFVGSLTIIYPLISDYLKGCLEISSGYSSAMVIIGSKRDLLCAAILTIPAIYIFFSSFRRQHASLLVSSIFIIFITFKHGFVRADGHVYLYFAVIPFILSSYVATLNISDIGVKKLRIYILTILLSTIFLYINNTIPINQIVLNNLSPSTLKSDILLRLQPEKYKLSLIENSKIQLLKIKFPSEVRRVIGDSPIDIVPSEISLVAANDLNWRPRPVFQSYSAYTKYLDNANFNSLSRGDRKYLIYSFSSIDGRNPFFDEPRTFFYILCHYKLLLNFKNPNGDNYALLEKREQNSCISNFAEEKDYVAWDMPIKLNSRIDKIINIKFNFKHSLLGKFSKVLFRSSPVELRVVYSDGTINYYRMVQDSASNGILVSHLARNEQEAFLLFKDSISSKVESFSIHTEDSFMYEKNIEIETTSSEFISVKSTQEFRNLEDLNNIKFLSDASTRFSGHIDSAISQKYNRKIKLSGWAINKDEKAAFPIQILITGGAQRKLLGFIQTDRKRSDVANHFHREKYMFSGWAGDFDGNRIYPREKEISLWAFDASSNSAFLLDNQNLKENP